MSPSENTALAALDWLVAMGADDMVGTVPVNRFAPPPVTDAAAQDRIQGQSGPPPKATPTPIAAKPVQPAFGAGPVAAAEAAARVSSLDELHDAMKAIDGGVYKRSAKSFVFSDGTRKAPLMVIGEAPGAEEDRTGKPFVGPSGHLLDKMLAAAGYSRDRNAYITNIVPWRPLGNRNPEPAMVSMYLPFLHKHIELSGPKVVLLMGAVAAKTLLETEEGITRMRGKWREIRLGSGVFDAMPTYHPAYLLRQPHAKGLAWRDLLTVRDRIKA